MVPVLSSFQQVSMESASAVKELKSAVADLLRSTKVYCKVTAASNKKQFETQLNRIAPRIGEAILGLHHEDNRAQVLACLCPAGFVGAVPKKNKKKAEPGKWVAPALEDWAVLYEPVVGVQEFLDEVEIGVVETEGSSPKPKDAAKGKKRVRIDTRANTVEDILDNDENLDPDDLEVDERPPKENKTGKSPADLKSDKKVNALLRLQFGEGDKDLKERTSLASGDSSWDLPKPRSREASMTLDLSSGTMKTAKTTFHTREKWFDLAMHRLLGLSGQEREQYQKYVSMINTLCRDYRWEAVADFDDEVRHRIKRGELDGFDVPTLHQQFIIDYGQQLCRIAHDPTPGGGGGGVALGGGGGGARPPIGKTCNWFNSPKGCNKPKCIFPHKCPKCGDTSHGRNKCPARK